MVKRVWTLIIVLVIGISALGGCAGDIVTEENQGTQQNRNDSTNPTAEGPVRTGLSISADVTGSKDASEEEDGLAKADILVVAVTVDNNGVIDDCVIDQVSAEIRFDTAGRVVTEKTTSFDSKRQKGDSYGMREASSIDAEWYEQVDSFCNYVKGMTLDQLAGIGLDEEGRATDVDLVASVTITVSEFLKGIEEAIRAAEPQGAQQGDVITVGITTTAEESEHAEGDDHGEASAHTTVTMETHNGNSVTSREIEDYTAGVKFNKSGRITERVLDQD